MPFNRSYRKKSSYGRRRRPYRKRGYKRRGTTRYSKKGYNVYRFKRSGNSLYSLATGLQETVVRETGVLDSNVRQYVFIPNSLPNFFEFTALYDQYKVKALKVSFIPMNNVSTFTGMTGITGATGNAGVAGNYSIRSYTALDFNKDNFGTPGTIPDMREYQNMRWKPYGRIHSRYFYPRINSDDTTTGFTFKEQPWLNTKDINRSHYGIHFGVDTTNAPVDTILYKIELKAYLAFKTPK